MPMLVRKFGGGARASQARGGIFKSVKVKKKKKKKQWKINCTELHRNQTGQYGINCRDDETKFTHGGKTMKGS